MTFTDTGYSIASFEENKSLLKTTFRNTYSNDPQHNGALITSEESDIGKLIAILARLGYEQDTELYALTSLLNPNNSFGIYLDTTALFLGLKRSQNTPTFVNVNIVAGVNTTFPAPIYPIEYLSDTVTVRDIDGHEYTNTNSFTLSGIGAQEIVQFYCKTAGSITVNAGEITILQDTNGIYSATAPYDGVIGFLTETDGQLLRRMRISTSLNARGSSTAILAKLNSVVGVKDAQIYFNRSDVVDADGRPAYSIDVTVFGGKASDIGKILEANIARGFFLDTVAKKHSYEYLDSLGNKVSIVFGYAIEMSIIISMKIKVDFMFDQATGLEQIKNAIYIYDQTMTKIGLNLKSVDFKRLIKTNVVGICNIYDVKFNDVLNDYVIPSYSIARFSKQNMNITIEQLDEY